MARKVSFRRSRELSRSLMLFALLGIVAAPLVAGYNPSPQAPKLKFEKCLLDAQAVAWDRFTTHLYAGLKEKGCDARVLPDRSKLLYTVRAKKGGRRGALCVYDFRRASKSDIGVLTDPGEESLTIEEFRIAPDSKTIWLLIGILDASGWSEWFPFDLENQALNREGEAYSQLRKRSQEKPGPIRTQVLGPVWSMPELKLYRNRFDAEKDGVTRFWSNWDRIPRRSKVVCGGTLFEMITGAYKKGHVFAKGQYVTSLMTASPWLPQNCWFVQEEAEQVVVYQFSGHGCRKSRLGNRSILQIWDLSENGILVYSWDRENEYLDLIPAASPKSKPGQ